MEVKTLMAETKEQEDEIIHIQTAIHKSRAIALKKKTGAANMKKALSIAVDKYLEK